MFGVGTRPHSGRLRTSHQGSLLHEFSTRKLVCGIVWALLGGNHACSYLPANLDCISVLREFQGPNTGATVGTRSAATRRTETGTAILRGGRGTREVLESIVIPPKAKAPFSLVLQTEWVKTLYDGGTITSVNERRIARDGAGRIYQERWLLVPKNGKVKSQMTTIQISDPNNHTHYNCFIMDRRNECVLTGFTPSTNAVYKFQGPPTGEMPDGQGSTIHEDMGSNSFRV
jgi:hypothetical protein